MQITKLATYGFYHSCPLKLQRFGMVPGCCKARAQPRTSDVFVLPRDSPARANLNPTAQNDEFGTQDGTSTWIHMEKTNAQHLEGLVSHLSPWSQLHLQKCYCYPPSS